MRCVIKFHKPGSPMTEVTVSPAVARCSAYAGHFALILTNTIEKARHAVDENLNGLIALDAKPRNSQDPRVWAFPNGSVLIFGTVENNLDGTPIQDDVNRVTRGVEYSIVEYEDAFPGSVVSQIEARHRLKVNERAGLV